jgi:hypothetical protein
MTPPTRGRRLVNVQHANRTRPPPYRTAKSNHDGWKEHEMNRRSIAAFSIAVIGAGAGVPVEPESSATHPPVQKAAAAFIKVRGPGNGGDTQTKAYAQAAAAFVGADGGAGKRPATKNA